jgi:hypothetical protein
LNPAAVAVAAACAVLPALGAAWLVRRVRRDRDISWSFAGLLFAGGALAGLLAMTLERAILTFTELSIEVSSASGGSGSALVALFLLVAPLEEALKVVFTWPAQVSKRLDGPGLGVTFAVCVALGFGAAETVHFILGSELTVLRVIRALTGLPAHAFCAGMWGYALGHRVRSGGRWFGPAWVFAVLTHALYDHIVFGRGPGLLNIALPMLGAMALVTWSALRDIARFQGDGRISRSLHIPAPPSLRTVRNALRRTEEPLMLRWIVAGAFVNVGMVVVCLAVAVFVARRFGIDLSLADESDMRSNGPLMLLGGAILPAFPIAGYLIARASGAHGVLEPAFAAGLAIGGAVALLSVTAPPAVIFAIAIAPIAFGLACGGAWFGIEA